MSCAKRVRLSVVVLCAFLAFASLTCMKFVQLSAAGLFDRGLTTIVFE